MTPLSNGQALGLALGSGAAALRPGDFEPGVGRAGQGRAPREHGAAVVPSDLAEVLATT
jgi:hypothetical protein